MFDDGRFAKRPYSFVRKFQNQIILYFNQLIINIKTI